MKLILFMCLFIAASFPFLDGVRRTRLNAVPAADTFQAVGLLPHLDIHPARLVALAALDTVVFFYPVSVQRDRVKETVDRSEGAEILAERTVHP